MKLIMTFNYFEAEFLLKMANILEETIIFKDKKQKTKLYLLELFDKKFYFALLGITQVIAMPTLQRIIDKYEDIDDCLVFGSAGSYKENVGKLVLIDHLKYKSQLLNRFFEINVKLPKWIKKTNGLPKLEVFTSISVNDVEVVAPLAPHPPKGGATGLSSAKKSPLGANTCFDMETAELAYLLKLNKLSGVFFRIITDFGEIDFEEMKKVYSSQLDNLLKYMKAFLNQ